MEPTLQDTIEAVTDAVSSVAASLVTTDTPATATTAGTGAGDSRPPGPDGEGDDIIPRFERWQLNFTARDIGLYARQLDFYKIELGAIGGSIQGVDVASNLSASQYRVVKPKQKRLYFMWNSPSPLMHLIGSCWAKREFATESVNAEIIPPQPKMNWRKSKKHTESKGYNSVTQIAKPFSVKQMVAGINLRLSSALPQAEAVRSRRSTGKYQHSAMLDPVYRSFT